MSIIDSIGNIHLRPPREAIIFRKEPKMANTIPAGVGERMQYLAHKFNDTTIRFILHYPGILDPDTLCAATGAVVASVDVLHSSFIANSQTCHWRINRNYTISDYFALCRCDGDPVKVASHLALQPVEHKDHCQFQVTLIQGNESSAVLVRISHLVVDGSDGKYLLNKLAESYRILEEHRNCASLDVKDGNRSAMVAYNHLGIREITSLFKMPITGVKTTYPFANPNDHGPLRMLRCTIPAELLGKARLKAKASGASVNDLLLTACYRSYAKTTGKYGPMSISGMMDLRQHCKDGVSEGLANMSGGLSTTLNYETDSSFSQNLADIANQTREGKNNPLAGLDGIPMIHTATKTAPMWLLLQIANVIYAVMSLSLTNLGNIPCEPLTMGGLKPCEGIFGGPLKKKPSVQIGAASFDGTAELTILGDYMTEDLKSLDTFLQGVRCEIECYLEEDT